MVYLYYVAEPFQVRLFVSVSKDWVEAGYLRQEAAAYVAEADWYSQLRHKYEHAARRPWELLAPDPPRPTVKRSFRLPR
jgi:hypothetical protein